MQLKPSAENWRRSFPSQKPTRWAHIRPLHPSPLSANCLYQSPVPAVFLQTKKCTNLQNRIIALSAELQASEESLTAARTSAHQAKASLAAATLQHHQISHELEEKLNAVTSAKEAAHQQLVEQTERTNELQADVLRLMEAEVS